MRFFEVANLSLQPSPDRHRRKQNQAAAQPTDGQSAVQAEDNNVLLDENGNAILTE